VDFKLLVEETLDEHGDIYTVEELRSGYSIWEVSGRRMNEIQRFLKKQGYYKLGIRGLVADIEPRNEIEQKAKEIVANRSKRNFFEIQSEIHRWVNTNLPKERVKEIEEEYRKKGLRDPVLVSVKVINLGLLVIPHKKSETSQEYEQRQQLMDKLVTDLRELRISTHFMFGLHFIKDMDELGITQFKVYKEYNLDKETEQAWGDIASEL